MVLEQSVVFAIIYYQYTEEFDETNPLTPFNSVLITFFECQQSCYLFHMGSVVITHPFLVCCQVYWLNFCKQASLHDRL